MSSISLVLAVFTAIHVTSATKVEAQQSNLHAVANVPINVMNAIGQQLGKIPLTVFYANTDGILHGICSNRQSENALKPPTTVTTQTTTLPQKLEDVPYAMTGFTWTRPISVSHAMPSTTASTALVVRPRTSVTRPNQTGVLITVVLPTEMATDRTRVVSHVIELITASIAIWTVN